MSFFRDDNEPVLIQDPRREGWRVGFYDRKLSFILSGRETWVPVMFGVQSIVSKARSFLSGCGISSHFQQAGISIHKKDIWGLDGDQGGRLCVLFVSPEDQAMALIDLQEDGYI